MKGKSKKAFSQNIETEMDAGKPKNQSLAIAYSLKRKAKKMAEGGMMTKDGYQDPHKGHTIHINVNPQAHPEEPGQYAEGGVIKDLPGHKDEPLPSPDSEDMVDRIMNKRMYSEGGQVANDNEMHAGSMPNEFDDLHLRDNLESSYDGANSGDENGSKLNQSDEGEDMIDRIMKKRASR